MPCCTRIINAPITRRCTCRATRYSAWYHPITYTWYQQRGAGASPVLQRVVGPTALLNDLTELPAAQDHAARVFGAQRTWFLVNGSTVGIHAALMATAHQGDCVVLARNCHVAAYAGLALTGGYPVYVQPTTDPLLGCAHAVQADDVRAALEAATAAGHRVSAVLLVSPTYFGVLSNVAAIAQVAHAHGVPLIVDEAHGAHLGRHPALPMSAIEAGADVAVQSTHKVLGALTQGSMLHCAHASLVDPRRLAAALSVLQSSSPSYLLMASLDAAAAQVAHTEALEGAVQAAATARARLASVKGVTVLQGDAVRARCGQGACHETDPLRVTISVDHAMLGMDGFGLQAALDEQHSVVAEMATETVVVCAFGIGSTPADGHALADALLAMCNTENSAPPVSPPVYAAPPMQLPPSVALTPRAAFFAPIRRVQWDEALGTVAAELVSVYPPGIPLLVPGEQVTAPALEAWSAARAGHARVTGVSDASLATMLVVDNGAVGM